MMMMKRTGIHGERVANLWIPACRGECWCVAVASWGSDWRCISSVFSVVMVRLLSFRERILFETQTFMTVVEDFTVTAESH